MFPNGLLQRLHIIVPQCSMFTGEVPQNMRARSPAALQITKARCSQVKCHGAHIDISVVNMHSSNRLERSIILTFANFYLLIDCFHHTTPTSLNTKHHHLIYHWTIEASPLSKPMESRHIGGAIEIFTLMEASTLIVPS